MPTSSKGGRRSRGRTGAKYLNNRKRLLAANRICALCGEIIPSGPEYAWPHPLSESADHIIPDSELTDPDDERHWSLDNLQPAHYRCNQKKGAGKAAPKVHPNSRNWTE